MPVPERPFMKRLLQLSGGFDELRLYSLDRLTRSEQPWDRFAFLKAIAEAGAIIVEANGREIDPKEEVDQWGYLIETSGYAKERKRIAQRTMDGKRKAAAEGKHPQGSPPYARRFNKATQEWEIDPERAKIYRQVIRWCLQGYGAPRIVRMLNDKGIPPPRRDRWAKSSVTRMLHDKTALGEWHTLGATIKIPALITPSQWEAVQRKMQANRCVSQGRPPLKQDVLLRKILVCGDCGRTMYVDNDRDRRFKIYRCSSRITGRLPCQKQHRAEDVDAAVWAQVIEIVDGTVHRAARKATSARDLEQAIADGLRDLKRLDGEQERLTRLFRRDVIPEYVLMDQAAEVKALKATAASQVAAARAQLEAKKVGEEDDAARLVALRRKVQRAKPADRAEIIAAVFPRLPGLGLRIFPDGRLEGHYAIPKAPGEESDKTGQTFRKVGTVYRLAR